MTQSTRPNILVVDDQPAIRAYLCERLTQHTPYRCTTTGDSREALELTHDNGVDVVVVALSVPEDAGMSLARQLRQEVPDLPVVLVTATRSFNAAVEAIRIGVFDCLLQPFEVSELIDAVDRAVEWRREAMHASDHPADLQQQVAERTSRLSETLSLHTVNSSEELQSLLEIVNQRRPETLAHARRVSQLSVAVAAALGVEESALGAIEQAALLHDLGKIAIPDAVIHKAGPLTAAEMALMRSHAQIGHDIAIAVPSLRAAAELILAANEWFDGTGYPRRLKGNAIPIGARVISAVDAFDALTSSRGSGDSVSVERANAELVRGAGSRFDPDVVAAWLQYLDRLPADSAFWDAPQTWQ
jgi:response regulator RpfG family c-di-GMP phosphodiesterase